MTINEVISLLTSNDQIKVTQTYFGPDEWIKSVSLGNELWLEDESGNYLPWGEFWSIRRQNKNMQDGWKVIET